MNKRVIQLIIFLMSISLIGIIGIQAYWIRLKAAQKAEEFDKDVYQSLADIKNELEQEEAIIFVQKLESKEEGEEEVNVSYKIEVDDNHEEKVYTRFSNLSKGDINNKKIIIDGKGAQFKFFEFKDSLFDDEEKLIKYINAKKHVLTTAINKIAVDFAFSESSLSKRLEEVELDTIISQNLKDKGIINLNYTYEVRDLSKDSIIISNDSSKDRTIQQTYQIGILDNDNQQGGILSLNFQDKTSYVIGSIWISLLISIALTLIMFFTFSYTIYAILKQKKISAIKADFINNMTHEFKTPIATISLAVDAMLHPMVRKDEAELTRFGSIIKKENARMNDQIERVLEAAKFEKDQFQMNHHPIEVNELLNELFENFKLKMNDQSGDIQLNLNAIHSTIIGDRMHFYNSLRNIVENGIKFSENAFRIKIETSNQGNLILIRIADKGIGMDSDTKKRIFDRFYRRTEGNLHNTKGFGLGLSYVQEIIKRMGGSIDVESKLGQGSVFTIKVSTINHEK